MLSGASQIAIIAKEGVYGGSWDGMIRALPARPYTDEEREEELSLINGLQAFEESEGVEFIVAHPEPGDDWVITYVMKDEVAGLIREGIVRREYYVAVPKD